MMKKLIIIIGLLLICLVSIGQTQKIRNNLQITENFTVDKLSYLLGDISLENSAEIKNDVANILTLTEPTVAIIGRITALKTTEQFRLSYDATNYMSVTLADDAHTTFTTVDPDGAEADINFVPDGNVGIKTAVPSTALEVTGRVTASTGFTDGTFTVDGSGNFTGVANFANTGTVTIDALSTANTEVLSPNATGVVVALETANISDIAITTSGGMCYISTAGTQTIDAGGTFEKLDEGAIAYTAAHLHDFTHSDGRLTYTGTVTKHFTATWRFSIESDEASALIEIQLYKDGALIPATNDAHDFTAVDSDDGLGFTWMMTMATDEYIEVWGTSDTNADTFEVLTGVIAITTH